MIAKVLGELGRLGSPETPVILSILVIEDLAMALYLPLTAVLLIGQGWATGVDFGTLQREEAKRPDDCGEVQYV